MASIFSRIFSWLTGRPKALPPEPVSRPVAPPPSAPPAAPAALPAGGPAQRGPAPILHDYRSPGGAGKKTGIFTRMIGMKKATGGTWQDPLWIPATVELQQLAKQEETRKKILVADSDPVAAADCKTMLDTEGFTVETAFDGEDCVEKIFKFNPDVVILRLALPKLNGLEILRRLRQLEEYRRLPVIALAETGSHLNEAEALAAGATRVFDRGAATEDDLFLALRTALRKRVFTPKRQLFQNGGATVKLGQSVIPMPGVPIAPDLSSPSAVSFPPAAKLPTVPVPLASPPARSVSPPPTPGPATPPSTASIPFVFETASANPLLKPVPPPTSAPLPVTPVVPASSTTMGAAPNAKRILLIEDEEMVANIYRARLLRAGYLVEVALDGETGLDRLRQSPPDAVLLDAHLPRMDGLQVLHLIRSDPQLAKLPVILCTAAMNARMQEEALLAGAVRVLDKTAITPLQVVESVQSLFAEVKAADITVPANASPSQIRKITTLIPELPPGNTMPDYLPPDDAAFEAEIREAFLQEAPGAVAKIQTDAKALHRTPAASPEREQFVISLYKDTHKLAGTAGLAGFSQVSRLSSSLEALLTKIQEKPDRLNQSCMRTLVQAVDYIGLLFSRASALRDYAKPEALALVVDDEMIGRRYVAHSLAKADLPYHAASNAVEALKLLQQHKFDIIFLDVEMPGMNGFDLCKHIRTLPGYDKTPCIFVTSLNSFEALSKSKMSGGTDFLAKPFSYAELSVKALTALAKRQMEQLPASDQQLVAAAAAQLSQHAPA